MALILVIVSANIFIVSILGHHLNSGVDIKSEVGGITTVERNLYGQRGTIYDRNQNIMAIDNVAYTLYASIDPTRLDSKGNPAYVHDIDSASAIISEIIHKNIDEVKAILQSDAKQVEFGVHGKYLTVEQRDALLDSKIPGLGFYVVRSRNNPSRTYISKVLGYSLYNEETKQLEGRLGIEEFFNEELTGINGYESYQQDRTGYRLESTQSTKIDAVHGKDITLTLDIKIQEQLERALQGMTTHERVQAKQAWGIVLEAKTGRILAMGEYPGFDPESENVNYLNTVTQGVYEPGSTMKTIAVASAIERGVWDDNRLFDSGPFYVGQSNGRPTRLESGKGSIHTITNAANVDYGIIDYKYGYAESSNVMIAELMSEYLSYEDFKEDLLKLKFFTPSDIDGIPIASGQGPSETDISVLPQITNAFGQGLTISMVQMAQAYTTFMGDGTLIKPYIIDSITNPNTGEVEYEGTTIDLGKVYSESTAKHMRDLLRYTITDGGVGRFEMDEVEVIGKTGTAQMVVDGAYSPTQFVYSSALAFPYEDPEVIVYTAYVANAGHSLIATSNEIKNVIRTTITSLSMNDSLGNEVIQEIKAHTIPSVMYQEITSSIQLLKQQGMNVVVIGDGKTVVQQYPHGGQSVMTNEKVFLKTNGTGYIMPDMSGWSTKEVISYWTMSGLQIEMIGSGHAFEQSIEPGSPINENSVITINFK